MAKRMKNDPAAASGDGSVDMTPMIDVTFQLIIFFMCVTDMANNTKERLMLPMAVRAEVDVIEPKRLVVNIKRDGDVVIAGEVCTDPRLEQIFEYEESISPKVAGYANKAIYIRADKNADYRHVARVMFLAQEARLWRVMFSTADPAFAAAEEAAAARTAAAGGG